MEDKVLPVIFLNLCGEILYVINQRLEAQNISPENSSKVIQGIVSAMLNDQLIEDIFKPQKMYTRLAMQSVLEKLVHSSIVRLDMSKLYDLILMVFKCQVANCQRPCDIILVTLNHLDAIKDCAQPYSDLTNSVKNLYSLLNLNYSDLSHNEYECLHRCIDAFLQDHHVRVRLLRKLGLQLPSGEIVKKKDNNTESTITKNDCQETIPLSCFSFDVERNFTLGTNIYTMASGVESAKHSKKSQSPLPVEKKMSSEERDRRILELRQKYFPFGIPFSSN